MHIRLAQQPDIPAILEISNWAALHTPANFAIEPESLADWLESWRDTHAQHPWLAATNEAGLVIGFAKSSPHRGRCAYAYTAEVSVYVHAEHHGRGIGRSLYARLIPLLKSQGYVTLLAGITTPNPASERLHASFGFTRIGAFRRVGWKFNRWHDVSYWQLALQNPEATPPLRILPVEDAMAGQTSVSSRP